MMNKEAQLVLAALNEYWKRSVDMAFIKDINGVYVGASQPFADMTGHASPQELVGKTDFEVFADQELAKRYVDDDLRLLAGGISLENYIEPITVKNERPRYCITSKYILKNEKKKPIGILGVSRDITHEYEARKSYEHRLRSFFEFSPETLMAVLVDVTSWRVVDSRQRDSSGKIISQYLSTQEYIENARDAVVEDEEVREFFQKLSQQWLQAQYESGKRKLSREYRRCLPDKPEAWVRSELHFILDPVNGNLLLVVLLLDISESKREYSQLLYAAERDPVTGLLNRNAIEKQIEGYLAGEGAKGNHALFMLDMDFFKQVNDTFGHQQGDSVLREAAAAISSVFRTTDIIGRMGGDEFLALMKDVDSEETVRRKASALVSALQFPAVDSQKNTRMSASVGVTIFRAGERDFDELYKEADIALYQSKEGGRGCFRIFGAKGGLKNENCACHRLV